MRKALADYVRREKTKSLLKLLTKEQREALSRGEIVKLSREQVAQR